MVPAVVPQRIMERGYGLREVCYGPMVPSTFSATLLATIINLLVLGVG